MLKRVEAPMLASNRRKSSSFARLVVLGVLVLVVALLVVIGYRLMNPGAASSVLGAARVNESSYSVAVKPHPAPDFSLASFNGETYKLSDLRGKVVVINFWSSTCPPCKTEAADLQRTWKQYKSEGVVFLGADVWDKGTEARQFLLNNDITYPSGITRSTLTAEYGITGIPETFIVDRHGRVVKHWVGPVTQAQLSRMIDEVHAS